MTGRRSCAVSPASLAAEWRAIRLSGHHGTNGQRQFIRRRLFDHERRCPGPERRFGKLSITVGGHENHPRARHFLLKCATGVEPAHVRQRNIDDHDVWMKRADLANHRAAVAGFANYVTRRRQQPTPGGKETRKIVCEQYPWAKLRHLDKKHRSM